MIQTLIRYSGTRFFFTVLSALASFAVVVILSRELSVNDFATVNIIISTGVIAGIAAEGGVYNVIVRAAASREATKAFVASAFAVRLALSLAAVLLSLGFSFALEYHSSVIALTGFYSSHLIFFYAAKNVQAILHGEQRIAMSSFLDALFLILVFGFVGVMLLGRRFSVVGVMSAYVVSSMLVFWIGGFLNREHIPLRLTGATKDMMWEILRSSAPFLAIVGIHTVSTRIDIIILSKVSTSSEVAGYSVSWKVALLGLQGVGAFNVAIYPMLSKMRSTPGEIIVLVNQTMRLLVFVGGPLLLLATTFSSTLLGFFFPNFAFASVSLAFLCVAVYLYFFSSLAANTLYAVRRERFVIYVNLVSLAFQIVLSVWLSALWGSAGTAMAYVIAILMQTTLSIIMMRRVFNEMIPHTQLSGLQLSKKTIL